MSLMMTIDKSGKRSGSAWWRLAKKASRALESGASGKVSPYSCATSTMRCQRSGERTTRRKDTPPCAAK